MFIKRSIITDIEDSLDRQAAVAIIGPRQVGKTTLALEIGKKRNAIYLDLEDSDDRKKIENPSTFFENYEDRLVILDEIHRVPKIFQSLRGIIDAGRRKGKRTGRFLILGSASIDLLKQSGETLAGRISYINMLPILASEVKHNQQSIDSLWLRGGFPDSYLASSDRNSLLFRKDFIRTYLEREVPMFGPIIPATTLERLWTMLAHKQGCILNTAELGRSIEMSTQTTIRYIDLLVDLLLVRRLKPFHTNIGKRLVKSPKIYVRDSGITHALLNLGTFEQILGHPVTGNSWEGFVIENLLSVLPWRSSAFFYRTIVGAEIDLIIQYADLTIWAIEIKRAKSAHLSKGFYIACNDLKPSKAFVVCTETDRYKISQDTEVISLLELMELLKSLS